MSENLSNRRRHWLLAAVKLLIVAIVIWFIRGMVVKSWSDLREHRFEVDYAWLAASGGLYLLGTFFCGLFWHRTLCALGQNVGLAAALRAFFIGHLGKYVPGKAMVVLLRAGLVRGPGVEASLVVVSIFFETLTMMSVGSLLAAGIVLVWFREQPVLFWPALGMLAVAGLPTAPPVFRRLVRIAGLGRLKPEMLEKLDGLGVGVVLIGWFLNVLGWIALGASYWAVLRALGTGGDFFGHLHIYVAAVSLATVLGFVSFVPGGAIVREAALAKLTELMAPHLGGTIALVGAVLLRLVWLAAELIASGALWWSKLRK